VAGGSALLSHEEAVEAVETVARTVISSVKDGTRREVNGVTYRVEEVTWPVSQFDDGSRAFACPLQVVSLTRGDAVLLDVRSEYSDGRTTYPSVGTRVGRWRRFRMGSPGEEGFDLHLATDEELMAVAEDAGQLLAAFGILGAGAGAPSE
jgi:hypothetical protein